MIEETAPMSSQLVSTLIILSTGVGGAILFGFFLIALDFIVSCLRERYFPGKAKISLKGKHILITGGSKGIGKEVAKEFIRKGANVTIMARNKRQLSEAREEISQAFNASAYPYASLPYPYKRPRIIDISVDVTSDSETVSRSVAQAVQILGPVYILVNCVGFALPKTFDELTIDEQTELMEYNYYGSTKVTKAVLPGMKNSNEGHIVFVASQGSLLGLYGFSAYCASKFAIRGFAESLAMELSPFNIKVTVNCPPDTDTPGFAIENKNKPEETRKISSKSGLFQPQDIARKLISDTLQGRFLSTSGYEGWVATTLCSGLINSTFTDALRQSFLIGPLRFFTWFTIQTFYNIIDVCSKKRREEFLEEAKLS